MKLILITLLVLLQFTSSVKATTTPIKVSSLTIDQLNSRLTTLRTGLTNIETARKKVLDEIEARYLKDKETRNSFFKIKEDELKAKEKETLDALARKTKPVSAK